MAFRAFSSLESRRIGSRHYGFGIRLEGDGSIGDVALVIGRIEVLTILSPGVSTLID